MIMTTSLLGFDEGDATGRSAIVKQGCRSYRMRSVPGEKGMAELPRLNSVIRALEAGQHALTCFSPAEITSAVAMGTLKFDGCVFEMEHQPWDGRLLRDCLQYMLNRAQIAKAASVVPSVTPMAR